MIELVPLLMFLAVFAALLAGYPVALTLAGVALLFAMGGIVTGAFAASDLGFLPGRLYGIIDNDTLIAVPLFVLMGVTLEKTRIAETLLDSMSILMSRGESGRLLATPARILELLRCPRG